MVNTNNQKIREYDASKNEDLNKKFENWTPEKIFNKTGIRNRAKSADGETAADLAIIAAEKVFKSSNISRDFSTRFFKSSVLIDIKSWFVEYFFDTKLDHSDSSYFLSSGNIAVKVDTLFKCLLAKAVIRLESNPPLKHTPIGTSAISCEATALSRLFSKEQIIES